MSILLSINCITYNHENYISDAIEGFLMQKTNFNFEILIGEDCSTDKTREIVEMYKKRYPDKIKIITSDKNVGFMKNMIRLHENSKGKYIAICEGDDYWTDPDKLQKQIDYMEKNIECTLCFHATEVVKAKSKVRFGLIRPYNNNNICKTEDIIIGGGGFCPTQSLIYRKVCMDNPPNFFVESPVGDYPLQIIVSSQGYAFYINKVMSAYRKGDSGSWSNKTNSTNKQIDINEGIINVLDEFDIYTDHKYNSVVNKRKIVIEFNSFILAKKFKKIKVDRYEDYFNSLSIYKKIKIYFRSYLPKIYYKIIEIKNK